MKVGIGWHHAGVDQNDRRLLQEAFTGGFLPVIFATSTLAMGVCCSHFYIQLCSHFDILS